MLSYQPKDEIVLTIGIPTYNRGHILDLFFGKLFNATHFFSSKIEIIVSDNCSNDNTQNICEAWRYKFEDFGNYLLNRNEKNLGGVLNLLFILRKAKGKYFLFLGDDDQLNPDSIKKIIEILDSSLSPSAIIQGVLGGNSKMNENGFISYHHAANYFYEYGNAYYGIINRKASLEILNDNEIEKELITIVWPQTVIGFLAIHLLKHEYIYITDFAIGGSLVENQNLTNKLYWITSLYGLLKAAVIIDNKIQFNWTKKKFVYPSNKGFLGHLKAIYWHSLIDNSINSNEVINVLNKNYGYLGKFFGFTLYLCDNYPNFFKFFYILILSVRTLRSPNSFLEEIKKSKIDFKNGQDNLSISKKRFGNWF